MNTRLSTICLALFFALPACAGAPAQENATSKEHAPAVSAEEAAEHALQLLGQTTSDDEERLRRQLVELVSQRAASMSADDLRRAITTLSVGEGKLPLAAQEILASFRHQAAQIQAQANRQMRIHQQTALADLQELQDKYTREGKLDEALGVRDLIRSLKMPAFAIESDPGNLSGYTNFIGKSFYFRVTGSNSGTIYGSDVYTSDSSLAVAAVHAGVLKVGETGVLRVTILGPQPTYASTNQNGIQSNGYGSYSSAFRLHKARLEHYD